MSEYVIYGETLTATADAIRESLNAADYSIDSNTKSDMREIRWVADGSVQILYREFVDYSDTYSEGLRNEENDQEKWTDKTVVAYSYLYNNDGELVPVLYWTSLGSHPDPDTAEPLFYIGKEVIEDTTYDKWRKIDDDAFGWDYDAKYYIYTNSIVNTNSEIEGIDPVDFSNHIYTIASSVGIVDDRYDEGYENGRNDVIVVGSEQAILDYAPMIIHGQEGANALSRTYFTNAQIGDVVFNYTDVLAFSGKGDNTSELSLVITNNNQILSCTVLINAVCRYQIENQLSSETVERTVTVEPASSRSISFIAKQAVGAENITWIYDIDTMHWTIA